MSYLGSTQSSSLANPPRRIAGGLGGQSVWLYNSTDPSTDVATAGYFTDGYQLGMKIGDVVIGTCATAGTSAAAPNTSYQMSLTAQGSTGAGASGTRMTSTMA